MNVLMEGTREGRAKILRITWSGEVHVHVGGSYSCSWDL